MGLRDMGHQHAHGKQREGLEAVQMGGQGPRPETSQPGLLTARMMIVIGATLLLHGPGHRRLGQKDQQRTDKNAPKRQTHSRFSLAGSAITVWV
ncbi:hypothetical protein D9M68_986580 [compost metagenome]